MAGETKYQPTAGVVPLREAIRRKLEKEPEKLSPVHNRTQTLDKRIIFMQAIN